MMREFDVDNSGQIDADEFCMAMVSEFCNVEIPRGALVDASTKKAWVIPECGTARLSLKLQAQKAASFDVHRYTY